MNRKTNPLFSCFCVKRYNYIKNLKGKLLLIHGSVDPTVVPQHSMTLLQEAVKQKVQIDFFTYPMHEHNVRGVDRVHLIEKMMNYIVENNKLVNKNEGSNINQ